MKKTTPARKAGLSGYAAFLGAVKNRIRAGQVRAIAVMQEKEGWGAGVILRLARDIANDLPEVNGFSERNLKPMVQFAAEYPGLRPIGPQAAAQITTIVISPQAAAQ